MGVKPNKLRRALTNKGFVLKEAKNHEHYVFYYNNEKTDIWMSMSRGSHGNKELGDPIVNCIKKEMHFDTKEQLIEYSECTFTEKDYVNMLKRNGNLEEYYESE